MSLVRLSTPGFSANFQLISWLAVKKFQNIDKKVWWLYGVKVPFFVKCMFWKVISKKLGTLCNLFMAVSLKLGIKNVHSSKIEYNQSAGPQFWAIFETTYCALQSSLFSKRKSTFPKNIHFWFSSNCYFALPYTGLPCFFLFPAWLWALKRNTYWWH